MSTHATLPLHEGWQFEKEASGEWLAAEVPGCVHTDLRRHGSIPDPFWGRNELDLRWIEETDWRYRLDFEVDADLLANENVELVAEGLDTVATVFLNGEKVAASDNMFVAHRIPVKPHLVAGKNRLEILFHNPIGAILKRTPKLEPVLSDWVGGRQYLRKEQCSFGWDWGPRFATSGIWRPIRLEGWSGNRIADYKIVQTHGKNRVDVAVTLETARRGVKSRCHARLTFDGKTVAESEAAKRVTLAVKNPELWWTNGLGAQPLYELTVELREGDAVLDSRTRRIGLCEIELDQHKDEWGRSFQFKINGKPVFAKGANWIPAHSFVNEGQALIPDLLDSAVRTHMNMLRVWGGGIYETELFYEGCLERGLLVWQDFMFACHLYPGDKAFLETVKPELECQIRRLRNYSNLALWCGNNETEQIFMFKISKEKETREDYIRLFRKLIPATLKRLDPKRAYIPSSAHNPDDWMKNPQNEESGDCHFWGVWHSRQPIESYEEQKHRFFSEFGMQAYPHVETAATFTATTNLFAPEMDNHQKNGGGNQIIFHYIASLFRFPKDYRATVYLSQVMQAYCIRFGIEHMRRNMPRTMGALYWQLNDCWPVASWSSIDFGGRWKALQYAAGRFFAPALVSVKTVGKETVHGGSNHIYNDIESVEMHTVCDGPDAADAELKWEVWSFSKNSCVESGKKPVKLQPGKAARTATISLKKLIATHGRDDLAIRTRLTSDRYPANDNTTFLTAPKRIDFPSAKVGLKVSKGVEAGTFEVTATCQVIAYQVYLNLDGAIPHAASDNFFDLFPGERRVVTFRPKSPMTLAAFRQALTAYSYRDSHAE